MKSNKLWILVAACVLPSSISRMINSGSDIHTADVLIAIVVLAIGCLIIWLFATNKITVNKRVGRILKNSFVIIASIISIAFIVAIIGFSLYKWITTDDLQSIIFILLVGTAFSVSWYINRWRSWWVKFLKTFIPKDSVRAGDWDMREKYYQIFDPKTNAMYGLRPSDGVFSGRGCVWLDLPDVDASAKNKFEAFVAILHKNDLKGNAKLYHTPSCIYANIVYETNYKSMNKNKQAAFRDAFRELDKMSYRSEYYVRYHGELGVIYFECVTDTIIRAIRTEPVEECYLEMYYKDDVCGFHSEDIQSFIERGPDWDEGSYALISEEEFFSLWRERLDYANTDDAYLFFMQSSFMYFAEIENGNNAEADNSRWTIESAARYIISNNDKEIVMALLDSNDQPSYWAARLFREIFPNEAYDAAVRIVQNCDDPATVSAAKELLGQWK